MSRRPLGAAVIALAMATVPVSTAQDKAGHEQFTAKATISAASGATATAPVTLTVNRWMSREEAEKYVNAFRSGGPAALRQALTGVAPVGSVQVGDSPAVAVRMSLDRPTDTGRLLTLITDSLIRIGAGKPGAKPQAGFDFGVIDLEVAASGSGSGTMAPGAKIRTESGRFIVEDYGSEVVRLVGVTKAH